MMESMRLIWVLGGLLVVIIGLSFGFIRQWMARRRLERRFKPVIDVEEEVERVRTEAESEKKRISKETSDLKAEADALKQKYTIGLQRYQELETEVLSLEEDLKNVAVGLYRPHFTYEDSESYKAAILDVRDKQKSMIRAGEAASCGAGWTVEGSERKGKQMIRQYEKLILRAFNAESEAAIANVKWNNFRVMKTRIEKAFEALNKLGTVMQISLSYSYRDVRLKELQLVFEAAEKKQQEREEQRRLRAEQREEEKAQRELMREKEEAEKDEAKYEKELERAKGEMDKALDAERDAMMARIQELEADLAEAHERKERAISQAQLTKAGYVYVISNVGTLGEDVLKIGLTRRLDPKERVHELGDASVPFPFDIHTMIYSENAPELEKKLHSHFWERRLNWANDRKEFFRVGLDEVGALLDELDIETNLAAVPEAREFRETQVAILENQRAESSEQKPSAIDVRFPSDPFANNA